MRRIIPFQTLEQDARLAAIEFHDHVVSKDTELVVFFCSSGYDLDVLATEMARLFDGIQVIGCTTSGEIGPLGCVDRSISGVSFSSGAFTASVGLLDHLSVFDEPRGRFLVDELLYGLEQKTPQFEKGCCFSFAMIDGLSVSEEKVAHALQQELGTIPLAGGSAGDDMKFSRTQVYVNGGFHHDAAVIAIVHSALPFKVFMEQHFVSTANRLVVTKADPKRRIVHEINGWPAAEEYARLIGADVAHLDSTFFSAFPVVVRIAGMDFVRSIQQVNSDGSLVFYCAIEEGVVLRMAHGNDMLAGADRLFSDIREEIGVPQVVLGADCVLRKMEAGKKGTLDGVERLFKDNKVVGFNSYGEQFRGIHVNQTITGIAIGKGKVASNV